MADCSWSSVGSWSMDSGPFLPRPDNVSSTFTWVHVGGTVVVQNVVFFCSMVVLSCSYVSLPTLSEACLACQGSSSLVVNSGFKKGVNSRRDIISYGIKPQHQCSTTRAACGEPPQDQSYLSGSAGGSFLG